MSELVVRKWEDHDVYIGRPGPWGNPFLIGADGSRADVIEKFQEWLASGKTFDCPRAAESKRQWMLDHLHELKGKRLACFCAPLPCHGDVLSQLANQ